MGKEHFLLPPQQQKFYYNLASALNFLGMGKVSWWGYEPVHRLLHFNGIIVTIFSPVCLLTQFVYLYVNYNDLTFDVIGILLSIIPICIMVNINLVATKMNTYKSVLKLFMTKTHISNFTTDRNNYLKQKIISVERATRYTAYYHIFIFGLGWFFWISVPVLQNIINREKILNKTMRLQTCIYMWTPFDYGYKYNNWIIIHVINVYCVAIAVMIMATLHCLRYILFYHLIGHIQILKNTLQSSFRAGSSDEETKSALSSIIKHHAFIIRIFDDLQTAFGANVTANYLHNLFSDSFILYQALNGGNVMLYIVMVAAYMGELILMSFVIEKIRKESADLPDIVYSIPWQSMSVSNQKVVLLILSRVQIELQFVSAGGLKCGVQPMVSILKTTFSYYVTLKNSIKT